MHLPFFFFFAGYRLGTTRRQSNSITGDKRQNGGNTSDQLAKKVVFRFFPVKSVLLEQRLCKMKQGRRVN